MIQPTWIYQNQPLTTPPPNATSFVYLIYNPSTNKSYVGKKQFFTKKITQKTITQNDGSKITKKKKITTESDWKSYNGSNTTLIQHAKIHTLQKSILHICYSKSQASYLELKEQMIRDVILSPLYYNDWVAAKITRKHLQKFQLISTDSDSASDSDSTGIIDDYST